MMQTFEEIKEEFEGCWIVWRNQEPQKRWLDKRGAEFEASIKNVAYDWFCRGIWTEKGIE